MMAEGRGGIPLGEAIRVYRERFGDSPPARVLFSGDMDQAAELMANAVARGRPLAEDAQREEGDPVL